MTIRAVFFDVFGTLMPYKNLPRHEILAKRARIAGLDLTAEQVKLALDALAAEKRGFAMAGQLAGEDVPRDRPYWVRAFSDVLSLAGITDNVVAYATAMCDSFLETEDFYLDQETLPTLRGLKQQGFLVGAVSNAPKGLAKTLDKYGILSELDVAVGSQDIGIEKPDPRIFHHALDLAGVAASQSAYVGDEYMTDAKAAQNAGLLGIFLDRNDQRSRVDVPRICRLTDLLAGDSPLNGGQPGEGLHSAS